MSVRGNEVTFAAPLPAHRLEKGSLFSPPVKQMFMKSRFTKINGET